MKKLILLVSLCLFFSGLHAQATLEIVIANIQDSEGTLMIALHDSDETFPNDEPRMTRTATAKKGEVTVTFEDLPEGNYAISLYHDLNDNQELDKNLMGIPKEPFGFSNDAMGTFGAPSFEKSTVKVSGNGTTRTTINLKRM